jgi:hypothetical protein
MRLRHSAGLARCAVEVTEMETTAPSQVQDHDTWPEVCALMLVVVAGELVVGCFLPWPLALVVPALVIPFTICQFLAHFWMFEMLAQGVRRALATAVSLQLARLRAGGWAGPPPGRTAAE